VHCQALAKGGEATKFVAGAFSVKPGILEKSIAEFHEKSPKLMLLLWEQWEMTG
jgi:hypothetical protein